MKKLVKTAKQQFEERLDALVDVKPQPIDGNEVFYTATENDGRFVLLYYNGENYYETTYEMPYVDLLLSNEFLNEMAYRFIDLNRDIRPLFDWYIDHKCYLNGKAPFDWLDVWMLSVGKLTTYQDIYEEVPDSISAKEQWEKDSADAVICYDGVEGVCKFLMDADNLTFYVSSKDEYRKYQPMKMSELRKNSEFITKYINEVNTLHSDDMDEALKWLATGEYTMSDCSFMDVYNALPKSTQITTYHDIQPIKEMVKLTPEQREALDMVEEAIDLFRERGGRFVFYSHDEEFFAVNGNGIKYETSNNSDTIDKLLKDGFVDVSDVATAEPLGYIADYHWATDGNLLAVTD